MKIKIAIIFVVIVNPNVTLALKTNSNKITSEFRDHIEDKEALDIDISSLRQDAANSLGNGAMQEVFSPESQRSLESLDPHSLESFGREERNKEENKYFNDFETDYTKPGASQHKIDVKKIINMTEKTLGSLVKMLEKAGIECDEKDKADEIIDPNFIEITEEKNKETNYLEHFCEDPQNTYNCLDAMTIRCEQKGWSHDWEPGEKEIKFHYSEILGKNLFWSQFWTDTRNGIHFGPKVSFKYYMSSSYAKSANENFSKGLREAIAEKLGVNIGNIHPDVRSQARGHGSPNIVVWSKTFAWETYSAYYKYRPGHETCDKWSKENWNESCNISSR